MNFKKLIKSEDGFSLVELLLVILIITLFSSLSIYSYLSYRESVVLNLAFDSFSSKFDEQKNSAVYGVNKKIDLDAIENLDFSDVQARCYGLYAKDNQLYKFSQDYFDKKVWNNVGQNWQYSGCADFENRVEDVFVLDEGVSLEVEDFILRFVPPSGDMEVSDDFKNFSIVQSINYNLRLSFNGSVFKDFSLNLR